MKVNKGTRNNLKRLLNKLLNHKDKPKYKQIDHNENRNQKALSIWYIEYFICSNTVASISIKYTKTDQVNHGKRRDNERFFINDK